MDMIFLDKSHQDCRIKHFLTRLIDAPMYDDSALSPEELYRIYNIVLIGIKNDSIKDIWRQMKDEFPRRRTVKERL